MYSKQNTNKRKQSRVSKSIYTARSERSDVEIHKHFSPSVKSHDVINPGVDSFPIIGDVESSNVEVSVNIDKPNKTTKKSFFVNNPTEISLDVVFPDEIETNVDFFNSNNDNFNNNAIQIETCTSLNKKVEDINKQLADLEKDIQFNFYDPKTKVGSNLKKYSSQLQSFSSSKNVSNTTSTASDYGNFNKFNNNPPKQNDPSIELKNEIFNYRSSLKQKDFEEKIEKRLEKLHKQKEQSELRKNNETKGEAVSGHEPSCPLSLKIDLPEPVLKIHEMQLAAKRLKSAESGAPNNNTQIATSSQTSLQKVDQTTIQNKNQEPSTSKSSTTTDHENNVQVSLPSVNVGVVQQLNSLLKTSTNELDELKSLLKEYLENEKANKTPRVDKNVQIQDAERKKKIKHKPIPSRSSSNSDVSLTSVNVKSKKKVPREPETCQKVNIEKKSKVIKIKQISKSTKTTKCDLSDISESNEMLSNSSSSNTIKSKPITPVKKQNKTKKPSYSRKNTSTCKDICKTGLIDDQQTELTLNIVSLASSDEEKHPQHIRDFIKKSPKDSNDLMNPPNTVRLALPENKENEPRKEITDKKKNNLCVQILPPLDIRRSLTTQKLPDVAIESVEDFDYTNKMSSENVKYIQIKHHSDKDLPNVVQPKPIEEVQTNPNKGTIPNVSSILKTTSPPNESTTQDKTIKELYFAPKLTSSSSSTMLSSSTSSEFYKMKNKFEEKKSSVREEHNLDIESLPSVRTLKEIQSFLEQKCSSIRTRLQEESKLKTGETLSLRYKLSEPPLWQSSISEPQNKTITLEEKPKPTALSPLKTYAAVKTPLSPLTQKQDNFQQVKYNPSLIRNKNPVDKSLQTSFTENMELPIAREDPLSQQSVQISNKIIQERKEQKTPPPLKMLETGKPTSFREITISTQTDNLNDECVPCSTKQTDVVNLPNEKNNRPLVSLENQVTDKPLTDENKFSNISTQINEVDLEKEPRKSVSFEIVTNQCCVIPKENKETQISQLDSNEKMPKISARVQCKANYKKVAKQDEKTQTTNISNETIIKEKQAPISIVRYLQSNATQTVEVKDTCTVCNMPETNEKEIVQITAPASSSKETKDCCTQYSPIEQQQQLDATEYKEIHSFRKPGGCENEEQTFKQVHYPAEERRLYYKSKMKNKRPVPQRYKVCSTPVSASSSSISAAETVSLSDGEMKLTCECSTSIGEIHLCRFANDIRKKVRILKKNPEKVLKESFGGENFKMTRQHKYNDNWFAYYVTKNGSSSENGTGSNLSSIKSNIETE